MTGGILRLTGFVLNVKVGCSPQERLHAARVRFDFAVRFVKTPRACRSDRLEDTICYSSLCERVRALVEGREFHLIEHLGNEVYEALRKKLPRGVRLGIRVSKPVPPIPGVEGAAEFVFGELGLL